MAKSLRKKVCDELDKLASKYIKQRDNHTCAKCGKHEIASSSIHVSHVIPKSRGQSYRWNPINLKCLCFHCHINWWHKNPLEASEWYRQAFPGRWEELQKIRNTKMTVMDLEELRDWYIREIENMEE